MQLENARMHTFERSACPVCGSSGAPKYRRLVDRLFGAVGEWNIRECEDGGCGCLWLDPCPTPETIGRAYENYYTHAVRSRLVEQTVERLWGAAATAYCAARHPDFETHLPRLVAKALVGVLHAAPEQLLHLQLLLRHLPPPRQGQKLLDIGCGEGLALKVLASVGWNVLGQDFDPAAVRAARSRGLNVREGSLESCAFPEASFDAVTMSHVLEHVHEPMAFLREIARILKPGGWLVSVTPNVLSEHHEHFAEAWRGLEPPRHVVLFSPHALRKIALASGFHDASITSSVRANRVSELASRSMVGHERTGWRKVRERFDRLRSSLNFYRSLLRGSGPKLRGDELILTARK